MKVTNLLGETIRQAPADCSIDSQKIMIRGGYIKYVSNGIYSLFTSTKKITRKIEEIIREEMNRVDGQEVLLPVVMPASLWDESGRYTSIGKEMARFKDRSNNNMVLGMTHEEASVHLAKNTAKSYVNYPFMIYQIQTKFRDEPRARGGLIRVKEFTMKDAYSFHTSQEDLEKYYYQVLTSYKRIFKRCGVKNFIVVQSDAGMMGGNISHEFMLLTKIGEDTLAICPECGYQANVEAAEVVVSNKVLVNNSLKKIYTPNSTTIIQLCALLKVSSREIIKAVVYQRNIDDSLIVVFLRGDLEVNETKLRNYLKCEIHEGEISAKSGLVTGYIGPIGLESNIEVVYDNSLLDLEGAVCGGNEIERHYIGVNVNKELGKIKTVDIAKIQEGFICPQCGKKSITLKNGVEIGNIFQLGTKYTESMDMTYLDKNGQEQYPIMGCYGIGIGRLCASICEESHDENGPIWPISIAPWQVQICNLRSDDIRVSSAAEQIYNELLQEGLEVLYDDRNIRPGAMFADADLFGIPIRIIVSIKNLEKGIMEVIYRDKSVHEEVAIENVLDKVKLHIEKLRSEYKE